MLVDDDDDNHEIFGEAVSMVSSQINCLSFTDAKLALHELFNGNLEVAAILLDLNMPIMSGQEFLSRIKSIPQLSHIPIIIYSAMSTPSTIEATKQLGSRGFIAKPDRFEKLVMP